MEGLKLDLTVDTTTVMLQNAQQEKAAHVDAALRGGLAQLATKVVIANGAKIGGRIRYLQQPLRDADRVLCCAACHILHI